MMKVCWISNIPSPYKVDFMNLLGKQVQLTCLFENREESDRESEWYGKKFMDFHAIFLDKQNYRDEIHKAARDNDILINSDYSKLICLYAEKQFSRLGKKVMIHADGGIAQNRNPLVETVMRYFMKQADYYLSSGMETDQYFIHNGAAADRIMHYRFTPFTAEELESNALLLDKKEELRDQCAYKEKIVIFSVGQQIPRKGYDILASAMVGIDQDVGVYIAGGAPEENVTEIIQDNHLTNIHFVGFKSKEELRKYYAAADIFALTTRYDIWGLVINEAMSFGLPIISTEKCVAAVEFDKQADNALIVPIENVELTHQAIEKLCQNPDLRKTMGIHSLDCIKDYSMENMVSDFMKALDTALE